MPLYSYDCPTHGMFDLLRPMGECGEDGECPDCKVLSTRRMSGGQRISWGKFGHWNASDANLRRIEVKNRGNVTDSVKERHGGGQRPKY